MKILNIVSKLKSIINKHTLRMYIEKDAVDYVARLKGNSVNIEVDIFKIFNFSQLVLLYQADMVKDRRIVEIASLGLSEGYDSTNLNYLYANLR